MTLKVDLEAILVSARESASQFKGSVTDTLSLQQAIMSAELNQEIDYLSTLVDLSLAEFKIVFEARCASRQGFAISQAMNHDKAISFEIRQNTPTNQLYVDIAIAILKPANLKALAHIVHPNTQRCFRLSTPELIPPGIEKKEVAYYMEESLPTVGIDGTLDLLAQRPATAEALSECVLLGNLIFPLHAMKQYGFSRQHRLYDYLKQHYPELTLKIYTHNAHFRTLESDILLAKNSFVTLTEAIKDLIRDLTMGDVKHSGGELVAGEVAELARERFLAYYNHLPPEMRQKLGELRVYGGGWHDDFALLVWRLTVGMSHADSTEAICVQVLSGQFKAFLNTNKKNALLSASMNEGVVASLREKYQTTIIATANTDSFHYPQALATQIFSRLELADGDALQQVLASLPMSLYPTILKNAWIKDITSSRHMLVDAMINGHFNSDELNALIIRYENLFDGVVIDSEANIIKLLSLLPSKLYSKVITKLTQFDLLALSNAFSNNQKHDLDLVEISLIMVKMQAFDCLKNLFSSFDTFNRMGLLVTECGEGESLLAVVMRGYLEAEKNDRVASTINRLSIFSPSDIYTLYRNFPDSRHLIAQSTYHMRSVLSYMDSQEILQAINDIDGLFAKIMANEWLFMVCDRVLNDRDMYHLLQRRTNDGRNALHHMLGGDSGNIDSILRLLPDNVIQGMLLKHDNEALRPLSLAKDENTFIKLLRKINPEKRLGVLVRGHNYVIESLYKISVSTLGVDIDVSFVLKVLMLIPLEDRFKFRQLFFSSKGDYNYIDIDNIIDNFIEEFFPKQMMRSQAAINEILQCFGVDEASIVKFNTAATGEPRSYSAMKDLVKFVFLESSTLKCEIIDEVIYLYRRLVMRTFHDMDFAVLAPAKRLLLLHYRPRPTVTTPKPPSGYEAMRSSYAKIKFPHALKYKMGSRISLLKMKESPGSDSIKILCNALSDFQSACFVEELIGIYGMGESALLMQAVITENEWMIDHLLSRRSKVLVPGSEYVRSMLTHYVKDSPCERPSLIGKLVKYGADNDRDRVSYHAYHDPGLLCMAVTRFPSTQFSGEVQLKLIEHLIMNGANIHARSSRGDECYSESWDANITALFIKNGADVNYIHPYEGNLLRRICEFAEGDIASLIDLIMVHGFDKKKLNVKWDGTIKWGPESSATPIGLLINRLNEANDDVSKQGFASALSKLIQVGANPVVWCYGLDAYSHLVKLFESDAVVSERLLKFKDKHESYSVTLLPVIQMKDKIFELINNLAHDFDRDMAETQDGTYEHFLQQIRKRDFAYKVSGLKKCFMRVDVRGLTLSSLKNDFLNLYRKLQKKSCYLSFGVDPRAPGNRLIFEIAKQLFQPATMREMLSILMPHIQTYLVAFIDRNKQVYINKIVGTVDPGINNLKVEFLSMSMIAFYGQTGFLISAIDNYLLSDHVLFHESFRLSLGSEFAKTIYNHNEITRSILKQLSQPISEDKVIRGLCEKDDRFLNFKAMDEVRRALFDMPRECWPCVIRYVNPEAYPSIFTLSGVESLSGYNGDAVHFSTEFNAIDGFSVDQLKALASAVFAWLAYCFPLGPFNGGRLSQISHPAYMQALYDLFLGWFEDNYCKLGPGLFLFSKDQEKNRLLYVGLQSCLSPSDAANYIQGLFNDLGQKLFDRSPGLKLFFTLFPQFKCGVGHNDKLKVSLS